MPYQAVTLAQLRQDLKDQWESVAFWNDADANSYLNEALRVWNLLTAQWKRRITITTTANTVWYSVPSTLVYNLRMDFSSFPMEVTSLFDLDNGQPNWEGETTSSGGNVPTRPVIFAPAGLNMFAIWPADAAGGNMLVVDGVRQTPVLTADADFVDLGQEEMNAILGYALHIGTFKEGGSRFGATQRFYQDFIRTAAEKNQRLKASTMYRRVMGLDNQRQQRPVKTPIVPVEG